MEHEEKLTYMRIAAGVTGFAFKNEHLDLLVSLYELVMKKKGKANVSDIVDVEYAVKKRAEIQAKSELLDKVSEKV